MKLAALLVCCSALLARSAEPSLQLTLPPQWYAVPGVPMSLYYDNVVLTEQPENYRFEVSCDIGRPEDRRWTVTPADSDVGEHAMQVVVKDGQGKVLEQGRTVLRVVPRNAGDGRKLRLLIVGDSLTNASHYPNEIARLLNERGNPQATLLGTHKPAGVKPGVAHEGYGGWRWVDFLTKFDPKPPAPGARRSTSPFVFADEAGKGKLDIPRYIREHCGGQPPDVVTFLLGINDCFRANPDDRDAMDKTVNEVLDHADRLLAAFREAAPKAVFAVGLTTPPNSREEAFVANYKNQYHRWGWKRIQHRLVQRMLERFGDRRKDRIHLVPTELNVDPIDGYPPNNGVHPNPQGYAQIGASFYGWLKAWLVDPAEASAITPTYDLLITDAQIADGTGAPLVDGAIAIKDRRIVAVGELEGSASASIDARGHVAAPGFIDVHTHSERICEMPVAENFLRMGVTTIITGNCGGSRTDVARFFEEIEGADAAVNVGTLVGHGAVREQGMGGRFIRAPNVEQLDAMKALVEQAMKDGAFGLSTGLIYVPGSFAKTDEIIELAKVVAAHGGIYVSHMRHETNRIFTALDELTQIAREAKVRAQLSHIKLSGPSAWGKAAEVLAYLDKARAEGLQITHDQYGYTASSTGLRQTIPDSALEGTREDFVARLDDPVRKAEIIAGMKEILSRSGRADYSYAVVARFPADPALNGLTIPVAARNTLGADALEDQMELLLDIERRGGGSGVFHGMNEADLQTFLRHPLTMVASDGGPRRLGEDLPHPRSYGNNARILGRYVRDLKLLPLADAIRRMTSLPAQTFQIKGRGLLKPGACADVVIFDPEQVIDPATFEDPHHYAEGFSHVIVNGGVVIRDGQLTDVRSGQVLRKGMP